MAVLMLTMTGCTRQQMQAELHRVDSLNQNEIPLDTVTTMQDVVDYFDTWGSAREKMLAHYLLGCVFRDRNDVPMALRCYRDAVGYADTTATDCDFYRLCRIYGQMAELFNRQRAPRLELEAEWKAVDYAWRAKDTLSALIFYGYLEGPYHMLNNMDSALYYNQDALYLLKKHGYPNYAAGLQPMNIDILLRQNNYQKAKEAIDEYERLSELFDKEGNIIRGKESYYAWKGMYYEGIDKQDSAEYYYRKTLSNCISLNGKEMAYKGLLSLYRRSGRSDSVSKYSELYCQTNDSASFAHSADEIVRTQALYNYEEHERIAAKKTKEAAHSRNVIIALLIAIIISVYLIYRYIKRQQQIRKEELMVANAEYSSLLSQYHQAQQDLHLSKDNMEQFREEKTKEIQTLCQKLALYQDAPQMVEHWQAEVTMLNSPIVAELHRLARRALKPSQLQWKELRDFIEQELPAFYSQINASKVCLSPQETLISILIRLQFSQGEQAALFDVSKQRINNIKSNINRKLFNKTGAMTLETNIMSL